MSLDSVSQYSNSDGPKWNPHVLNQKEEEKIPTSEKEVLMTMPVEQDSIWSEGTNQKGGTYWYTIPLMLQKYTPMFHNMLRDIANSGVTHLVLGGFRFQLGKDKVIRGKYEAKQQFKPGGGAPSKYTPKPLAGVMIGPFDEVNEYVQRPENVGKWNLFGDWKFNPQTGVATVGIVKNSPAQPSPPAAPAQSSENKQ